MKKFIIFIMSIIGITANAERFQYNNIWYETLSNNTCQTASCTSLYLNNITTNDVVCYSPYIELNHEALELKGNPDPIASANWISVPAGPNFGWNTGNVVIPEKVYDSNGKEYTVTRIGEFSFAGDNNGLTGLVLPETVTEIGEGAFFGSDKLSLLDLGNVIRIETGAFYRTTGLRSLRIPDSTTCIGDFAFSARQQWSNTGKDMDDLYIGNSVEYIGKYAFYLNKILHNDRIMLPNTLKYLGYMSFSFTRTAGTSGAVEQVYCSATEPPYMPFDEDGCTAFGNRHDTLDSTGNFYNIDHFWEYTFFCLHVPQGSLEKYKNADGWGSFSCIIDDIIPEVSTRSVQNIVGYIFMVPGEELDIVEDNIPGIETFEDCDFEVPDTDVISLQGKHITANKMGQEILLLKRYGNKIWNGNNWENVEPQIIGAVIVFVCPTITLVYDNIEPVIKKVTTNNPIGSGSDYDGLTTDYATYQHLVVHNSFPRFQIEGLLGVEIELIERAKVDEDGSYTNDGELSELEEQQYVGETTQEGSDYIVPINPVVENRVIKLSTLLTSEQDNITTSSIELDNSLRIYVYNLTVFIDGFNDIIKVYNLLGQLINETTSNIIILPEPGIYILDLKGTKIKVSVK